MKKLLIAVAVIGAAIVSEAAAFTWGSTASAYGITTTTLDSLENNKVYSVATSGKSNRMGKQASDNDVVWTFVMTLARDGFDDDVIKGSLASSDLPNGISKSGLSSDLIAKGSGTETVDGTYSIVIKGEYTDASGKDWTLTSNTISGDYSFGELSDLKITTAVPTSFTATTEAVPEPFSGALALLGMGAIALRRKMKKAKKA